MNIEEQKAEIQEKYEKSMAILEMCKNIKNFVLFVDENSIYVRCLTYEDFKNKLHEISKRLNSKYELESYHMNGFGLSILYTINETLFIFLCNESERVLRKISGGKCRIETKEIETKSVVCDL